MKENKRDSGSSAKLRHLCAGARNVALLKFPTSDSPPPLVKEGDEPLLIALHPIARDMPPHPRFSDSCRPLWVPRCTHLPNPSRLRARDVSHRLKCRRRSAGRRHWRRWEEEADA